MKKYLIRSGYNPYNSYTVEDVLYNNITGGNSGNQLYAYGVYNVLSTKTNILTSTFYRTDFTEAEIDYINSCYDAFVLPLADAFRQDWIPNLHAYTNLIRKIKIPCIVIGVCLRAPYNPDLRQDFSFDEAVKEFVSVVLDKSSIIGLRGRTTGRYLEKFGFKEGRDFMAIGCPSLYTYGNTVKTKDVPNNIERLVINLNPNVPGVVNKFIYDSCNMVSNNIMVLQENDEFARIFFGRRFKNWPSSDFPVKKIYELAFKNQIKLFFDPQQWFDFVSNYDLSIGTRFHGTVANILSGLPHVMIPIDSRMQELVEFHHITHLSINEISGNILDHLGKLDMHSFEHYQNNNLDNYIHFLRINGLNSVFDDNSIHISRGCSPLEMYRDNPIESNIISTYVSAKLNEKIKRRSWLMRSLINQDFMKKNHFSFINKEDSI